MPKLLSCIEVSPMAAELCGFAVQTDAVEECLDHLTLHSKARHGLVEADITPEMRALLRSRMKDVSPAEGFARMLEYVRKSGGRWKVFICSDAPAREDCVFAVQTDTDDDVITQVIAHGKLRHGLREEGITPEQIARWRSRIRHIPEDG